jgi:hypothetical protein
MSHLADALDRSRKMIGDALADARAELADLNARRSELEALIAQGEAALGGAPQAVPEPGMTLHRALEQILQENGNTPMTARALADAVTDQGLYRKRDGSAVEVNQVHARTNNYQDLFEKDGARIRLREESPMLANHPPSLTVFQDDDRGFFSWLDDHQDGYFINCERRPKPTYLVLHHHGCPHIDRSTDVHWTKDYIKICSPGRGDLEEWATTTVGGDVTLCRTCFS